MTKLSKQQGYALLVLVALLATAATTVTVKALNSSSANSQIARDKITAAALAQAKDALIGYATSDPNRPGELPCPDIDGDGQLTLNIDYGPGTLCKRFIGFLPWKTLRLPELRDGANAKLWYAVSQNFYAGNPAELNSDTLGNITVRNSAGNIINNGCATNCPLLNPSDAVFGTGAVAVIIAPGDALKRQDNVSQIRSCTLGVNCDSTDKCTAASPTTVPKCNPINYLDNISVGSVAEDNASFTNNSNFITNDTSTHGFVQGKIKDNNGNLILNDQLLVITHDTLFPSVEKVVGKRVRNLLNANHTVFGNFPFAASFTDPSSAPFIATTGNFSGLLPSFSAVWASTPSYSLNAGSANVSCSLNEGYKSLNNARARCDISSIVGTPSITITGALNYMGLWRKYDLSNIDEVRIRRNSTNYSATDPALAGMNAAVSYTVNADSSVTVTFTGLLIPDVTRIELRDVVVDSAYIGFTNNNWHQVMYYAVSPGYAPGGINDCEPLGTQPHVKPYCLTVNGNGGGNNKRAVIVMTGKVLTGHFPRTSDISDYLELENSTPSDLFFENRPRSDSFNDQVIIVAP